MLEKIYKMKVKTKIETSKRRKLEINYDYFNSIKKIIHEETLTKKKQTSIDSY